MGKKFTLSLLVLVATLLALPIQAQDAYTLRKAPLSKVMKGIHGQELKKGYTFVAKNVKEVAAQARLTAEQKAEINRIELAKLWENNMERVQKGKFSRLIERSSFVKAPQLTANAISNGRLTAPKKAESVDVHGIITAPGDGVVKVYKNAGSGYYVSNQQVYKTALSGTTQIVECEDGTVYFKDIVSTVSYGVWVKGTKVGNTITVPTKQPVAYSSDYGATISVRWGALSGQNVVAADNTADNFTFVVDDVAGTISLQGTSEDLFMATLWDDDDSWTGYGVYETVYTYDHDYVAPTTVTVTPPAGLETETWYASGHTYSQNAGQVAFESTIKVGFDGSDVYLQGVFSRFPDAWMKGTISGSTVTFAGLQVQGDYSGYTIYATGGDNSGLIDYVMTYDAENKVISSENALFANAAEDKLYYLIYVTDLKIAQAAPGEEEATTAAPVDVLPYENALNTADLFGEFGVIDSNKDGKTWSFSSSVGAVGYSYSTANDGDDWLVSPAVKLEGGKKYHFAIDVAAAAAKYPERIEVKLGAEPKASALTTEVVPATDIDFANFATLENDEVVVAETGYYHIGIHAISDADQYNLYVKNFLIEAGVDPAAPAAVTNFDVVPTENKLEATVSFIAPSLTSGGETLTSLTKVDVIRDKAVVASLTDVVPGAQVQYVDNDNLSMGNHTYQVIAYNEYGAGVKSEEKTVAVSAVIDVPVVFDFATENIFNLFTVINANADDYTWKWNANYGAYYLFAEEDGDDYLISPAVNFEAGKNYKVVVNASCASSDYPEKFRVLVGKAASVEGLTQEVLATTVVDVKDSTDFEAEFAVAESGQYYVAVQALSDADMYRLNIHKISIEKGAEPTAPAAVTEFAAVAGEKGALEVNVSFNAPAKAVNGTDLTDNLTINVLRDGEVVKTFEAAAPGSSLNWKDENVEQSKTYVYQVVASNASGAGLKSDKVSVYVGFDVPADLANLTATDNATSIKFAWDKVGEVGATGGYVNPAAVDYEVWSLKIVETMLGQSLDYDQLLASETDKDNYVLAENTDEGVQDYKYWAVQPVNVAGVGTPAVASMLVGAPYTLPFFESFTGSAFHYIWDYSSNAGIFVSEESSDDDAVALQLTALDEPGTVDIFTGKVSLKNAANPTLLFDVKSATVSKINVIGSVEGGKFTAIKADAPVTSEYTTIKVPLNDLKDARFVQLGFSADFANATIEDIDWETYEYVYTWGDLLNIDNIRIVDLYEHDVEVALNAPASVVAGSAAKLQVKVSNNAENAANGFTLKLTAGEKEIYNKTFNEALKPFSSIDVEAAFETTVFDEAGDVTLTAEVVYENDLNPDNNADEAVITVKEPTATAPSNLVAEQTAEQAEKGEVTLTWTAPAEGAAQEVTEDFTAYENGANETGLVGEWTLVNANGKTKGSLFKDLELANDGLAKAWQVFNPEAYGITNPSFNGPNGSLSESYLISGYNLEGQTYPDNDDWLISPVLTGIAQEISFDISALDVQYGPSSYEVLASSTDTELASFTKVAGAELTTAGWGKVTAQLPEGTKFFAIRNTTPGDGALCVALGNIKYQKGGAKAESFNIYVDAATAGNTTEATAILKKLAAGNHVFAVTAVYANGAESKPVTATLDVTNAISEILSSGKSFTIYTVDGKLINRQATNLNGLKGSYIINNKKVILK